MYTLKTASELILRRSHYILPYALCIQHAVQWNARQWVHNACDRMFIMYTKVLQMVKIININPKWENKITIFVIKFCLCSFIISSFIFSYLHPPPTIHFNFHFFQLKNNNNNNKYNISLYSIFNHYIGIPIAQPVDFPFNFLSILFNSSLHSYLHKNFIHLPAAPDAWQ